MPTYQELLSQNLALFQWQVAADRIPSQDDCQETYHLVAQWFNGLGEPTVGIVRYADISRGLATSPLVSRWPAFATLFAGNPYEEFSATMHNIMDCMQRAEYALGEQAQDASGEGVSDADFAPPQEIRSPFE